MRTISTHGLYKRVKQRGGSAIEAATVASDSTVNFMRSGTVTKKYNRVIPFFNATIQSGLKSLKNGRKTLSVLHLLPLNT